MSKKPERHSIRSAALLGSLLAAVLAGCGGGNNSANIGGTVNGLIAGTSVTLQDNSADNLTLSSNQGFTFPTAVAAGASYDVTVLTQPVGETCSVANGTGIVDSSGDDVTNVAVTCSVTSSVGGTVSGLAAGNSVWLTTNGQTLPIASNGAFAFPGTLPAGTAYDVTVSTQPAQQTCTVANASGTVVADAVAQVSVTCQ